MQNSSSITNRYEFALSRIVAICLAFLLAGIPLIVNPTAFDYYSTPKSNSLYVLIIITVLAAAARRFLFGQRIRVHWHPLMIPLGLFALSAIISTFFSVAPQLSIHGDQGRKEGVFTLLSYAALPCLFACLIESRRQLHNLLRGLLIAASAVSLYGIVQYLGFNPTEHFVPLFRTASIASTIGNANFLGKFLVLVLPLFLAYYCSASSRFEKAAIGAGMLLAVTTLILTFTRASWLGATAAMSVFVFCGGRSLRRHIIKALTGPALVAPILIVAIGCFTLLNKKPGEEFFFTTFKSRVVSAFDVRHGIGSATRLFIWHKTLGVIRDRPVFGYGPDTNVRALRRFNLEFCKKFNDWGILDRAHNNYLDVAVSQGLAGLAAYLGVIITFMIWLRRALVAEADPHTKLIFCGVWAAFWGYLINDLFIFSIVAVSPAFWSLMGATVALKELHDS